MNLVPLLGSRRSRGSGGPARPAPENQGAFTFDPSPDELGNHVHTTLQGDQPMPRMAYADPFFPVTCFGGVQLTGNYTFDGQTVTMTDGPWKGLQFPFLVGANSTPPTMLMSCMLPMYSAAVRAAFFTENCWRGHNCLVTADIPWNAEENGFSWDGKGLVGYLRECESWGFKNFVWRGGDPRRFGPFPDPLLAAVLDAGVAQEIVWGKEVDIQGMSGPDYEDSIQEVTGFLKGRIRVAAHFSNDPYKSGGTKQEQGRSYPLGAPRDDFLRDWSSYNDVGLDLALQLCCDAPAGVQGAYLGYAHRHVHQGIGDAVPEDAKGKGAPNARIYAFEYAATALLYQTMTEQDARRRGWEMACAGQHLAGCLDGLGQPDGSSFLTF